MTTPGETPNLLQTSPQNRLPILRSLLIQNRPILLNHQKALPDLSAFSESKGLHFQASEIFYKENSFEAWVDDGDLQIVIDWLTSIAKVNAGLIKRLEVEYRHSADLQVDIGLAVCKADGVSTPFCFSGGKISGEIHSNKTVVCRLETLVSQIQALFDAGLSKESLAFKYPLKLMNMRSKDHIQVAMHFAFNRKIFEMKNRTAFHVMEESLGGMKETVTAEEGWTVKMRFDSLEPTPLLDDLGASTWSSSVPLR